jgi:hypothetical protein
MLEQKMQNFKKELGMISNFLQSLSEGNQTPSADISEVLPTEIETGAEKYGKNVIEEQNSSEENGYFCHHLKGGAEHPGVVVETAGLANIKPPRPGYRPQLPVDLITGGKISEIQLERIIYAGSAHEQILPGSKARAGISIGDGTGVGKTGTILGIILDNWFSGRKKTIWFSVKFDLIKAVRDEMARLGINLPIKQINDYKPEEEITLSKGIVFCTYQSLIARSKKGRRRLDQLTEWLGAEGLLVFDEGHRAKNFFADDRSGKGTQTSAAVAEIQDLEKFPDYRVVYSSATAATEVRHLAYMIRLGLWGQGSAFENFAEFAREIEEGGIGAMEMVARDLKAMGRYLCGSLSLGVDPENGLSVEYREVVHHLTAHQREMYDNMARLADGFAENRKGTRLDEQREIPSPSHCGQFLGRTSTLHESDYHCLQSSDFDPRNRTSAR